MKRGWKINIVACGRDAKEKKVQGYLVTQKTVKFFVKVEKKQ